MANAGMPEPRATVQPQSRTRFRTRGAREKVMASGPWKLPFSGAPPSVAGRAPPFPLPMLRLARLSLRPWLTLPHLLLFPGLLLWHLPRRGMDQLPEAVAMRMLQNGACAAIQASS